MAEKTPDISVIFPVYNVEAVVSRSLRSVLRQSFRDFELIIVDDATPDESISRIKTEIGRHSQDIDIRIITHETNKGLSEARNTGIRAAKGKYLFFMDSDDELPTDALTLHFQAAQHHRADFTDANFRMIGHPDIFMPYKENRVVNGNNDVLKSFYTTLHVSACNKLVRRSLIIGNGIYFVSGMLYEDMCWLLAVAKASEACVCLAHETYDYIIRHNSITRAENAAKLRSRIASYKKMLTQADSMTRDSDTPDLRDVADRWMVKTMVRVKYNVVKMPLDSAEKREFFRWCAALHRSCSGPYNIINRLSAGMFRLAIMNSINLIRRF